MRNGKKQNTKKNPKKRRKHFFIFYYKEKTFSFLFLQKHIKPKVTFLIKNADSFMCRKKWGYEGNQY